MINPMQRPDNPFLFSISCCSFGDEERDFRRRNSNKALSTPRKDDWAAILNDRTRPVGFTARAAEGGCDSGSDLQHRQEPRWSPRPKDFLQNTGPAPEELVEKTQQQWARVEARRSARTSASTSRAPSALSNSSYHSPNGSRAVGSTFNDLANLFLQVRCVLMHVCHHARTYLHPLYIRTRPRLLTPTRATDRRTQPEKPSHINLFHGFHSLPGPTHGPRDDHEVFATPESGSVAVSQQLKDYYGGLAAPSPLCSADNSAAHSVCSAATSRRPPPSPRESVPVTKRSAFSGAEAVGHGAGHQAPRLQCDVQEELGGEAGGTGALARQLLETAGRLYEAGNYHEAREAYQGVTAALQRAKETEAASTPACKQTRL